MIAVQDPDVVLGRFVAEVRVDPDLVDLAALVPTDRKLSILDVLPLATIAMAHLRTPSDQLRILDALGHAYARARGLHLGEESL